MGNAIIAAHCFQKGRCCTSHAALLNRASLPGVTAPASPLLSILELNIKSQPYEEAQEEADCKDTMPCLKHITLPKNQAKPPILGST